MSRTAAEKLLNDLNDGKLITDQKFKKIPNWSVM